MSDVSRRTFLKRLGYLTAAGVANPFTLNLAGMADAAAAGATDYKALVCVFLYGGNDHSNTLIPIDSTNYATYKKIRSEIALDQPSLLELKPLTSLGGGLKLGLHPRLRQLRSLFHLKKLAILQNVGTLIEPTTLEQYKKKQVPLPPKLFSHNDQQAFWQSAAPEGVYEGWGGRLGDLSMSNNARGMFTCINTSRNAVFLTGNTARQYSISSNGAIPIWSARKNAWLYHSQECATALRQLVSTSRSHIMENEINATVKRSLDAEEVVSAALKNAGTLTTKFNQDNNLAKQLEIVAKLIKARADIGVNRQVFMVSMGGFDTHDDLLTRHNKLLGNLDEALASFYQATEELKLTNNVTTFTASDFGRTLTSNGDGSDHGWGSHQFILGGAVKGQNFYGTTPEVGLKTATDVNQGRLLPTTSVDQYAATLARWFGVPNSQLNLVAPNIGNFNSSNLGFMI